VQAIADVPGGRAEATSEGQTTHVLRLAGLPPASDVDYRLLVDGADGPRARFRTPAVPGTAAAQRAVIGAFGDMGTSGPIPKGNAARMKERGIELLLTVGDNAYDDGAAHEWDPRFFGPFKDLLPWVTLAPAMGDHEYRTPYGQGYLDAFVLKEGYAGERNYSFDWGDVHVVALDTNCIKPVDPTTQGCDRDGMLAWLRNDLAATRAPWKIAIFHRPVLATGKYGVYPEVQAALMPIFEELGVDLVLQGHNHLYERTWPARGGKLVAKSYDRPGAPVYVTTGGGGDWLYPIEQPIQPWVAMRESVGQHSILTLDRGSLRVDAIRPDGSVLDTFTIVKDVPPPSLPDDAPPPPPSDGEPVAEGPSGGGGGGGGVDPGHLAGGGAGGGCQSGTAIGLVSLAGVLIALRLIARRRARRV
jgi:hypothetical protein